MSAGTRDRGALLLEVIVALTVFVMGGMTVLAVLDRSMGGLREARLAEKCADLARSAMARIEAGLATPETLNGPVARWEDDEEAQLGDETPRGAGDGFADAPPEPSEWELQIETEPTSFDGLTLVTVRAVRLAAPDSDRVVADYTLRQLVRLSDREADRAGTRDSRLGDVDARPAQPPRPAQPTPPPNGEAPR